MAVALDTLEAAIAADHVAGLVVVTNDEHVAHAARELGAHVLADPGGGLNAALDHGADEIAGHHRNATIAALQGDLPSLRPAELAAALMAAADHDRAFVADVERTGTTLLTVRRRSMFTPAFGLGSRAAHRRLGFVELGHALDSRQARAGHAGPWPSLQRDVDTERSLRAAAELVLGRHTRRVLAEIDARASTA